MLSALPDLLIVVSFDVVLDLLVLYHVEKSRGIPRLNLLECAISLADEIADRRIVVRQVGESNVVLILRPNPYL